jgi:hypothetical protein
MPKVLRLRYGLGIITTGGVMVVVVVVVVVVSDLEKV